MQPTKYPSSDSFSRSGSLESAVGARCVPEGPPPCGGAPGRNAPLDLIEEHLTDKCGESAYRRATQCGRLLENWFVPVDWNGVSDETSASYVLKVQPFVSGGYEATVRTLNLEKIALAVDPDRRRGKRDAPDEVDPNNVAIAAQRAKTKVRLLVKNMAATHLVTFTRREGDGGGWWDESQWSAAWDRFRRTLTRAIGEFPYVAILEKHQKGNYHLHVAWCGKVNVKLVRRIWLAITGGKGSGNIDSQLVRVPFGGDRSARIARYISKYVSKGFEQHSRFNKKRYWASRQTLEEARRYVLAAASMDDVVREVRDRLGLDFSKFFEVGVNRKGTVIPFSHHFFPFPDGGGFWLNYVPELHGGAPPF